MVTSSEVSVTLRKGFFSVCHIAVAMASGVGKKVCT